MPRNTPIRLVIDANIARSAGPEHATFPTSKNCRDFLMAVERHGFSIVSTPELREEWNRHQSNFFRTWRTRMMGRKRIETLPSAVNLILRGKIENGAANEGERDAMLKDCHLLEVALQSDKRIASCETRVPKHFARVSSSIVEIRSILWVNPDDETETIFLWLENGAPAEKGRQLRNYS